MRGDQEYNKSKILKFCTFMNIQVLAVAANHHKGNALVERANRNICEHVLKISLAEPRMSLVDIVSAATFHNNATRGHNKASLLELLYNHSLSISTIYSPYQH